jgi:hypothetical protein
MLKHIFLKKKKIILPLAPRRNCPVSHVSPSGPQVSRCLLRAEWNYCAQLLSSAALPTVFN